MRTCSRADVMEKIRVCGFSGTPPAYWVVEIVQLEDLRRAALFT